MFRFPLDGNYGELIKQMGLPVSEVLKKAELPEDLFGRDIPSVTEEEYYRFMEALEYLGDEQTLSRLAQTEQIASFSPSIFAAYCSKDGWHCLKRLEIYKALISAILLTVTEENDVVTVTYSPRTEGLTLPKSTVNLEFIFIENLLSSGTKTKIKPIEKIGNSISFHKSDMDIPFISRSDSIWNFMEPELKKRLDEMDIDDSFSARIRSCLTECLPAGETNIEDIAKKFGLSKRSLQRKLQEENTTFQKQLNHVRELMAKYYLKNTKVSSEEIAFLLGYQDTNSFFRAFSLWNNMNVSQYRETLKEELNDKL